MRAIRAVDSGLLCGAPELAELGIILGRADIERSLSARGDAQDVDRSDPGGRYARCNLRSPARPLARTSWSAPWQPDLLARASTGGTERVCA
jgi:hypothetical protein